MKKLYYGIATGVAAIGLTLAMTATLSGAHPHVRPSAQPRAGAAASPSAYSATVDAAHQRGLRVWIEADLVKRWLQGPASFRGAVATIAALAGRPGVVGIKIADEIGYHDGLDSPDKLRAFLNQSAAALRSAAPGKLLLVDIILPELGCLPNYEPPLRWATICAVQKRGEFPQLTLTAVDGYLQSHDIDVIDLSTGLLGERTYSGWGVNANIAQRAAWAEVDRRGWNTLVRLQARKALAHPGAYAATNTLSELITFLDIPRAQGAVAVDVWTWRQRYRGQIYRLLDPGLRSNALWEGLEKRRAEGVPLFTHLSPHSVEVGLGPDLDMLAKVFSDVFVAAGTG